MIFMFNLHKCDTLIAAALNVQDNFFMDMKKNLKDDDDFDPNTLKEQKLKEILEDDFNPM